MNLTKPHFDEHEIELLGRCLDSGWVTQGPFVSEFEKTFAARHQVRYALATTSCTAALHMAATALGLGRGDEVVVPAFTWITSAHCAEYVGARAVFADVEFATFNLDPEALEAALTPSTRAIVVVHLFGLAAKMKEIMAIAKAHNLYVIEDAACAVGTTYAGKPVGGIGDLGCFSFHPRKVVTTGEGGMVTTNHERWSKQVNSLRNHGATGHLKPAEQPARPYNMGPFDQLGYNLRLSDIQAAVGVAQLAKLDGLLEERKRLGERYSQVLKDLEEIALPRADGDCGHTYQSYVIRVLRGGMQCRNAVMDHLDAMRIQTRPGTHAVHRLGYYAEKYRLKPDQFPISAACEDTTITLPLFPGMTERDQDYVAEAIRGALAASK